MADLFDVGERGHVRPTLGFGKCKGIAGMAAQPGGGPEGETCGTCQHRRATGRANTYYKCDLMRRHWTHGPGTDIKLKFQACRYWEGG